MIGKNGSRLTVFWRWPQPDRPGAKDAEIKSGTLPYSGPGSACGIIGKMELENFDRIARKPFGGFISASGS
jgi:hypothetical protein